MNNRRTLAMFDSLVAAGDEGLSFDGIVSIPEFGLERIGYRRRLADRFDDLGRRAKGRDRILRGTPSSLLDDQMSLGEQRSIMSSTAAMTRAAGLLPRAGLFRRAPSRQDDQISLGEQRSIISSTADATTRAANLLQKARIFRRAPSPQVSPGKPVPAVSHAATDYPNNEEKLKERLPQLREELVYDDNQMSLSEQAPIVLQDSAGHPNIEKRLHERLPQMREQQVRSDNQMSSSEQVLRDSAPYDIEKKVQEILPRMREEQVHHDNQMLPGDRIPTVSHDSASLGHPGIANTQQERLPRMRQGQVYDDDQMSPVEQVPSDLQDPAAPGYPSVGKKLQEKLPRMREDQVHDDGRVSSDQVLNGDPLSDNVSQDSAINLDFDQERKLREGMGEEQIHKGDQLSPQEHAPSETPLAGNEDSAAHFGIDQEKKLHERLPRMRDEQVHNDNQISYSKQVSADHSGVEKRLHEKLPQMREEQVDDDDRMSPGEQKLRDPNGIPLIDDDFVIPRSVGQEKRQLERLPQMRKEQVHDDDQVSPGEQVPTVSQDSGDRPNIEKKPYERLPQMREKQVLDDDQMSPIEQRLQFPSKNSALQKIKRGEKLRERMPRMRGEQVYDNDEMLPKGPFRCATCESSSVNPRNLVILIDGTSNKFARAKSNVRKLSLQIKMDENEIEQRKHYLKGIGAYEDSHLSRLKRAGNTVVSVFEMSFGLNVEKNIKDAYGWLVETYRRGDQIYLFGFSRGAYQVRVLASMIHEIGLVRERQEIERAHHIFQLLDQPKRKTSDKVKSFKKEFCWPRVRIHFVGVWDTVSSVGFVKRDVHVTASASVTNACHFRHALALDERRVKFMPEYFAEVNAHRSVVSSSRRNDSDVKEVWFAGCHSDVGGANQQRSQMDENDGPESHSIHAGNVPLLWMRQEAATHGLVFEPEMFAWGPHDVDLGREESLTSFWKFLELMPIRHQISFSGTGKHKRRWHLSRPRSIIPGQHIHPSVLSGGLYTPRATLGNGIDIPIVQGEAGALWATERRGKELEAMSLLLTSLLAERERMLKSLEKVLFLLISRPDNSQLHRVPRPEWFDESVIQVGQPGFTKFALAVIYDIISDFSLSRELRRDARRSLRAVLFSPGQQYFRVTLYVLQFLTRHSMLRRHYTAHVDVISALMDAFEETAKSHNENLFPLVMDSLRYLISDDGQRIKVIKELTTQRLSLALGVKAPKHLMASLRMIACLAQHLRRDGSLAYLYYVLSPGGRDHLERRIINLAKQKSPVGATAVEALVALDMGTPRDFHFSNILGYLGNVLPPLDAETGNTTSTNKMGDYKLSLSVLRDNGSASLNKRLMDKFVHAIQSPIPPERTRATLTLLKLCNVDSIVRRYCSEHKDKTLNVFLSQLKQKERSLLAAYALRTCFGYGMWSSEIGLAEKPIVSMFTAGWFDNAVGRVEGFKIFRELLKFGNPTLRQAVEQGIVPTLMKMLEGGGSHEVRMSLICLDILEEQGPVELQFYVYQSLRDVKDSDRKVQEKGIRILSALAQTRPGQRELLRQKDEIAEMLPSSSTQVPSSYLVAINAVLRNLFRNEELRKAITGTIEYDDFTAFLATLRGSRMSHLL